MAITRKSNNHQPTTHLNIALPKLHLVDALKRLKAIQARQNGALVKLTATPSEAILEFTGASANARFVIAAEIDSGGVLVLPMLQFHRICEGIAGLDCAISSDSKGAVTISGESESEGKLSSVDAAQFPEVDAPATTQEVMIEGVAWHDIVARVLPAVSQEVGRDNLNGLSLSSYDGKLFARGTDGRRLASVLLPVEIAAVDVLIPTDSVALVTGWLDADDTIRIAFSERAVTFTSASQLWSCTVSLSALVMPASNEMVAQRRTEVEASASVRKDELAEVLNAAAAIGSERDGAVKIELARGKLVISLANSMAIYKRSLVAEHLTGTGSVSIKADWLVKALKAFTGDIAIVRIGPMHMMLDEPGREDATFMAMGMRGN